MVTAAIACVARAAMCVEALRVVADGGQLRHMRVQKLLVLVLHWDANSDTNKQGQCTECIETRARVL